MVRSATIPRAPVIAVALIINCLPAEAQQSAGIAPEGSTWALIGAGTGLGLAGFVAGGLVGSAATADCNTSDFCQLEGAFYGAAAGGTFGMALGVHLGNRRRGSLALDFLTGAGIWGLGIALAAASNDETVVGVAFVTIPIAQLASTIAVERATGRSRARRRAASVALVPLRGGRLALSAWLPLPSLP